MQLKEIYRPIKKDLTSVERLLKISLRSDEYRSVAERTRYLLDTKGKRLRPALVILSAKAVKRSKAPSRQLSKVAAAVELIHIASLIHDDIIDHSVLRHNRLTVNSKWGDDLSIVLGDYLYSRGFELISSCKDADILSCISQATRLMCEGELVQVCERGNLDLLKERYYLIVKKKTASLFAASCQAGAMLFRSRRPIQNMLRDYGLNFGIAFQIIDDSLDLISERKALGKSPGEDFKMGELTLPVINLLAQSKDKERLISLFKQRDQEAFCEIRQRFIGSAAFHRTEYDASYYAQKAKKSLNMLENSPFKESLFGLADYVVERLKVL